MKNKFMTIFILFLILSLPFVTASRIASISVRGSDGQEDIVDISDEVTFEARILNTDDYTAEEIQFRLSLGNVIDPRVHVFESCAGNSTVVCTFTKLITHDTTYNAFDFVVTLYQTPSLVFEDDVSEGTYYVDTTAPTVRLGQISQNSGVVTLPLSIKDTIGSAFPDRCSGIANVSVSLDEDVVYTQSDFVGCLFDDAISISMGNATTGNYQLCALVTDKSDNEAVECREFELDLSPPQISNLRIFTGNADPLFYMSNNGVLASVGFEVIGEYNPSTASIIVDNASLSVSCAGQTCTATDYSITNSSNFEVLALVRDSNGNEASASIIQEISVDATSPQVTSLISDVVVDGNMYYTPEAIIVADIAEDESGFYAVRPDLSVAGNTQMASECVNTNSSWLCLWDNTGFALSDGIHSFTVSGYDDSRNQLEGSTTSEFYVDTTAPFVTNIEVFPADNATLYIEGGSIVITFTYEDISGISSVADFGIFGAGNGSAQCTAGDCIIVSQSITQGGVAGTIPLNITDSLGNSVTLQTPSINVLRLAGEGENHFTHSLRLVPDAFENSSSQFLNQRAYADLKFRPVTSGQVDSVTLLSCQSIGKGLADGSVNESAGSTDPLLEGTGETDRAATAFDAFGDSPGSTTGGSGDFAFFQNYSDVATGSLDELMIDLTLKAIKIQQPKIQIECDLEVSGIDGDTYVEREIEKAYLEWDVYELAVGSLPDNYEEDLEAAYKDATEGMLNTIASWQKFFRWAENFCTVWVSLKGIVSSLSQLGITLDLLGTAQQTSVVGFSSGSATQAAAAETCWSSEQANAGTEELLGKTGGLFTAVCQFVNCQFSLTNWLINGDGLSFGSKNEDLQKNDDAPKNNYNVQVQNLLLGNTNTGATGDPANPNTATAGGTGASGATAGNDDLGAAGGADGKVFGGGKNFKFTGADLLGFTTANTKDNLVLSVLNLCIPGIVSNLDKIRQIKCRYVLCLLEDVPAGTPKQACDAEKEFAECQYAYGQIFALLPLVNVWDYLVNTIKSFFSSPFALLGTVGGLICTYACVPGKTASLHSACRLVKNIKEVGNLIKHVMTIVNIFKNPSPSQADYCSIMEEKYEAHTNGGIDPNDPAAQAEQDPAAAGSTQYQSGGTV